MKRNLYLFALLPATLLIHASHVSIVCAHEGNFNSPNMDERELIGNIVALADAIANAVPTVPTTPDPTEYPTESPKPSPSPSEYPTATPTISPKPTGTPTANPTESPKPSPSPTDTPTSDPTETPSKAPSTSPTITPVPTVAPSVSPSLHPTLLPSVEPSYGPTVSVAPSDLPSDVPSDSPSTTPTVSMHPSESPSMTPTISAAPSDLPSTSPSDVPTSSPSISMAPTPFFIASMRQTIVLTFEELHREMTNNVTSTFQATTQEFLQGNMPKVPGGTLTLDSVRVLSQSLIRPSVAALVEQNGGNRNLQASGLECLIEVSGEYESWVPDEQFDFEKHIFIAFEENWALYKNFLLESSNFFTPLIAQSLQTESSSRNDHTVESSNLGSYIAVCVFAFVSVTLGLMVSVYALRHYRYRTYDDDDEYNKGSFDGPSYSTSSSMDSNSPKNLPVPQQKPIKAAMGEQSQSLEMSQPSMMGVLEGCTTPSHASPPNHNGRLSAMSPNTMEVGQGGCSAPSEVSGLASTIMCQMGGFSSNASQQDPPDHSSSSRYQKGEPTGQRARQLDPTTQHVDEDRETTVSNALRGSNIFKISRDPSVVGVKFPYDDPGPQPENSMGWDSERSRDPAPGSQVGGRLGAADIHSSYHKKQYGPSTPESSAYGSSLNGFLNMIGGSIGARPLVSPGRTKQMQPQNQPQNQHQRQTQNQPQHHPYHQETNNYESSGGGGSLYDVFAPSGALGIVVDTTKDGPAVHSLKQNSPMLGLINPGDLIVGLDDEDTRNMTAATLTRLMARKSHQHERKITLMAADNY